jgi:hypothetical protein
MGRKNARRIVCAVEAMQRMLVVISPCAKRQRRAPQGVKAGMVVGRRVKTSLMGMIGGCATASSGCKKGFHPYGQDGYVVECWEARNIRDKEKRQAVEDRYSQ